MTYRLFAGLAVPDEIAGGLRKLQKDLPGARWRPAANFHVTLCFYGEVTEREAHDLDDMLAEISAPVLELALEGAGWFGSHEPSAVWARVRQTEALSSLAGHCARAARRLGLTLERHPFTPHVTLAYLNETPVEAVRVWCDARADYRSGTFTAPAFHLYSSHKGKAASRYVAEADYPLQAFGEI